MPAAPRSGLESKRSYRPNAAAASGALDSLPPLASLRVFEACARRRSLSDAAAELSLSASTVTHHVRVVEKWAGGALFARRGARVVLTRRAESALRDLQHAFSYIAAGAGRLKQPPAEQAAVAVSVVPCLASKWLLPRLERFREQHPTIDVWVAAGTSLVDFEQSDVDLAIRYGPGDYPGLSARELTNAATESVPSPDGGQPDWRYWLVWPSRSPLSQPAKTFADWLLAEFNAPSTPV